MTLSTPLWLQAGSYNGDADRTLIDAIYPSGGVITGADLAVTQRGSGANMSVDVATGKCVVVGTDTSGQHKYLCESTAVTNVPIATAPGTGNSRFDLIVATVQDPDGGGAAGSNWIIHAITGTAGTSPTAPSVPASSTLLATVHVGANVTSILNAVIAEGRTFVGPTFYNRPHLHSVSIGTVPPPNVPLVDLSGDIVLSVSSAAVSFTFSAEGFGPFTYGYVMNAWIADGNTGTVSQLVMTQATCDLSHATFDAFEPDGTPVPTGSLHIGYRVLGA